MTNAVRDPLSQTRLDAALARVAQLDVKILDFGRRHPDIARRVALIRIDDWWWRRGMVGGLSGAVFVTDGLRPLRLTCFPRIDPLGGVEAPADFHRRSLDHVAASLGLCFDELVAEYRADDGSKACQRLYQFWTSKG